MFNRDKGTRSAAEKFVEWKINKYQVVLFTKSYSPEGQICHSWLRDLSGIRSDNYDRVCYEKRGDVSEVGGLRKVRVSCFPNATATLNGREPNPRPPDLESDALTTLPRCPIVRVIVRAF
ncbi:hypothetical protein ElyMa_005407300 [Elysia marginata]|uniref:Uncharacterized protein n=1 Tax=Elysia marginata TaxID=1093978 RepID=A0AAV4EI60_9GAST|nr:hypothetical protein ElyMa_005407300 [Elysia marginata]